MKFCFRGDDFKTIYKISTNLDPDSKRGVEQSWSAPAEINAVYLI